MESLPLELELSVERLRRHLEQHPENARRLAIAHFEDFSVLTIEYKKLEIQRQILEMENIKLKSAKVHRTVFLPSFISNRGASWLN